MDNFAIYLIVAIVVGLLAIAIIASIRGGVNQSEIQTGWRVEKRVIEMTDETLVWVSALSESGSEVLQLDRDNDMWGINFTSTKPFRDGNLLFRFNSEPPIPVSWTKFAFDRRAILSDGDVGTLVNKLSNASELIIQFSTTDDLLSVSRFDIRGFKSAAADAWPLAIHQ